MYVKYKISDPAETMRTIVAEDERDLVDTPPANLGVRLQHCEYGSGGR